MKVLPLILAAAAGLVCWRYPLFHVVPLKQAQAEQQAGVFDAAGVAARFWQEKLLPASGKAIALEALLKALSLDAAGACREHGRTLGIGGAAMFLVQGSGRITAVADDTLSVSLADGAQVSLNLGLLFDNTVRDASGLLDVSAYPDSQDFNALGTQLNALVESRIQPDIKGKAAVGRVIRFAGCLALEDGAIPEVLSITPIQAEWP